jgi:hypothetical protein
VPLVFHRLNYKGFLFPVSYLPVYTTPLFDFRWLPRSLSIRYLLDHVVVPILIYLRTLDLLSTRLHCYALV